MNPTRTRVGIDATSWTNLRGYGRFARNALARLVALDGETDYLLFAGADQRDGIDVPAGARLVTVDRGTPAAAGGGRRSGAGLLAFGRAVHAADVDAFVFPSVYGWFPVVGAPAVLGVHDLIAERLPGLTLPSRTDAVLWRAKQSLAVRHARRLFTVSHAARDEIAARFGLAPESIAVVPEAADPLFGPRPAAVVAAARAATGLAGQRPYLLYVGGISPHKNLPVLIAAYGRMRERLGEAPALVVVGELESDPYVSAATELRAAIEREGVGDDVVLPGFVDDETLAGLYCGAAAVVLPSLAEGFGLPAVEAAASGAPVVLSDIPAHRESLGDAAMFFPPDDVDALAAALERIVSEPALRADMRRRGLAAAGGRSWDDAAHALRGVIAATLR